MKKLIVLLTTDLSQFKLTDLNREVDEKRVEEIAADMTANGLLLEPIVVTNKGVILSGQHRFMAAQKAGLGIYFIVDESVKNSTPAIFEAVKRYNQMNKAWTKNDYVKGMALTGTTPGYKALQDFNAKFPMFSMTENIMFLLNSGTKYPDVKSFKSGNFEAVNITKAKDMAKKVLSLKEFFPEGYNRANFVRTLLTLWEKEPAFDFDRLFTKVQENPKSLYLCGDKQAYSEMLNKVYNKDEKAENKVSLKLVDVLRPKEVEDGVEA